MAYPNNNNYPRGQQNNRGSSGRSGNTPPQPAPEIRPESLPDNYVDQAEAVMRKLSAEKGRITTSKLRNLLSMVSGIYNVEVLRTEDTLLPESVTGLMQMRIRTAYECGRDDATKQFVKEAHLLQHLKGIGTSRMALIHFAHYMEALVAYHRYFGGKEN